MDPELTIILPCRNEEKALDFCLESIKKVLKKNKIKAQIIVSDSSKDNSPKIAKKHKALLVKHNLEGYGRAYLEGIKKAEGKYIFMADADGSYDFNEIPRFIKELRKGYDLVSGNRFQGKIEKGAMSWHHKYIGNPFLSFVLNLFYKTNIKDIHCGMKAVKKSSLRKLNLISGGMEFASEMIIKAAKNNLKTKELSINYYRRKGNSKLKSFSDGWRHLRLILLHSPFFLFFIPGMIIFFLGIVSIVWLYTKAPVILGTKLSLHLMFISSVLTTVGYQLIIFFFFAKTYSFLHLNEKNNSVEKLYEYLTLEKAVIGGIIMILIGFFFFAYILLAWSGSFKELIIGLTLITLGTQTIFSSFVLSILSIK